jgi:uncharacterized coiled-coil protein SlyX
MTKKKLEEELAVSNEFIEVLNARLVNREKVIVLQKQMVANLREQKENSDAFIEKVKGLWEK